MKSMALALGAMILAGAPAACAAPAGSSHDIAIPFVNHGGIQDWRAVDDHSVYIQSQNGQWFKAETMGVCIGLDTAITIGFDTGPIDTFDKFSKIVVRGQPCPLKSLTRIAGKPPLEPRPKK